MQKFRNAICTTLTYFVLYRNVLLGHAEQLQMAIHANLLDDNFFSVSYTNIVNGYYYVWMIEPTRIKMFQFYGNNSWKAFHWEISSHEKSLLNLLQANICITPINFKYIYLKYILTTPFLEMLFNCWRANTKSRNIIE